jgi:hypothetical protein
VYNREHPAKALQDSVSQVDSAVPEAAREVLKQLLGHLEDERRWRADLLREIRLSHECDWNNSGAQSQAFTPPTTDDERRYAQFLLHSLKYTAMQDRYEGIAKSHKETFTWIFEEPKEEQKPWSSFIDWLKHGTAPYWITGKAGSGKSTLMKFISRNDETLHYLKEWAGDAKLVVAHFYFWISGSPLQMSQEGLLRSMLLEMLEKEEDQISRAFLRRWESMTILGEYDRDPFTREELEQALESIVREGSSKMKFCFFIDGLDEYQGDPSELLRLIQRLGAASPHLKFCLSSRPWVAFEDTFKECPKLMLQDLTRGDINRYINSRLRSHDQFPALEIRESDYATTLMDNVANKAEGVFLWVVLVVKSLSEGLTHGVRVSDLQEMLDALPSDLDELFSRILNSIDPANVLHSSQLFQLFRACSSVMRPSITILHYADENNAESFKTFKSKPLRQKVYNAITETMRRRFNHLTKGLLEVSMDTNRVIYLHRTVADYICLPQVWERIASPTAGTSFNPNLILARSLVIEMKIIDPKDFTIGDFWTLIEASVELTRRSESFSETIPIIDGMCDTIHGSDLRYLCLDEDFSIFERYIGSPRSIIHHLKQQRRKMKVKALPVMCMFPLYLEHKLAANAESAIPAITQEDVSFMLFLTVMRATNLWRDKNFDRLVCRAAVRVLLDHGADPTWSPVMDQRNTLSTLEYARENAPQSTKVWGKMVKLLEQHIPKTKRPRKRTKSKQNQNPLKRPRISSN